MKPSSTEILQNISSFTDYLYPFKKNLPVKDKRVKQKNLRELYMTRAPTSEDVEISKKMTDWLMTQDRKSLNRLLTHKNPFITTFLLESYNLSAHEGRFFFKIKENQPRPDSQPSVFYVIDSEKKSWTHLDSLQNTIEKDLESRIRLCDQDAYCDLLSFDPNAEVATFLALAKQATDNQCFQVPCRVSWEYHTNTWIWNYPPWFKPGKAFGFSLFALASFERTLWTAFWASAQLDPRASPDAQVFRPSSSSSFHSNLLDLSLFLASLPHSKQVQIVGDKALHAELGEKASNEVEALQNGIKLKKINCDSGSIVFILSSKPLAVKNLDVISERFEKLESLQFVEFLMFSTLERVASTLDLVCRKVLASVASAMSEKKAEDLMKDVKIEESPKKFSVKKKSKKRKSNLKKRNPTDQFKEIAEDILNNIVSELEENPEFQVKRSPVNKSFVRPALDTLLPKHPLEEHKDPVSSYTSCKQTKPIKPLKQQTYRKDYHRKPTKRPHSSQTKPPSSNQSTPKVQTSKTSTEVTPTKPEAQKFKWSKMDSTVPSQLDISEFPPLPLLTDFPEFKPSLAHIEIEKFCKAMTFRVGQRFQAFGSRLDMVYEMISMQHPEGVIYLFGSFSTGLAIDSSDIDLLVSLPRLPNRREIVEYCCLLSEIFSSSPDVRYAQAITSARIPIVKIQVDDFSIDISYEDDENSHQGLAVQALILQSIQIYPGLRELTLLFKHLLHQHNLNCNFLGGLNAYGLFVWVLSFFRSLPVIDEDLGTLCSLFLNTFSTLDPLHTGIDARLVPSFYPLPSPCYNNLLTIDPITGNNITSGLFQSNQILSLFLSCKVRLLQSPSSIRSIFSF